jgi:formamidopyrimidine-DNA glycosylase
LPELPEIETIVRGLRRGIVGKRIARAEIRLKKMAQAAPHVSFERAVAGERVAGIGRRGKYAVIELGSGRSLVTSLRMTGRLVVSSGTYREERGTHVVLWFTDGTRLNFADIRTFGRMRLVEAHQAWDRDLGIEPLSSGFTPEAFIGMLSGRRTPIKALLLDQRRIAGIGNIYACEALWEARIRPSRPAGALTKPATRRLHDAVVGVLNRAISLRGSSVDDYVDADGLRGDYQSVLSVYGRNGRPCKRCGRPIVRTVLAQRGTWWCRSCQR